MEEEIKRHLNLVVSYIIQYSKCLREYFSRDTQVLWDEYEKV